MPTYTIASDNYFENHDFETDQEAEDFAEEWIKDGSWGNEGKIYVNVSVSRLDEEGEVETEWSCEVLVGEDAEEPECVDGEGHSWESPEFLGGCKENPGVWGRSGTQVAITTCCSRCGQYCDYVSESTPGQYPRTAPQYSYREADEESLEWVWPAREMRFKVF